MRYPAIFNHDDDFNFLQEQIKRMFDKSLGFSGSSPNALSEQAWGPVVDICETDENYQLEADLPGMNKDDINIDLQGNVLTLSGERKHEERTSDEGLVRTERRYGKFVRSFTLPQNVDPSGIKANYNNGVLKLVLPKSEESKPKQIKVES